MLGSAPTAELPEGFGSKWSIVTVNASQSRLDDWGIASPSLTIFRNQMLADDDHQNAAWRQLRGRSTEQLVMLARSSKEDELRRAVPARSYDASRIAFLSDEQKGAIVHQLIGLAGFSRFDAQNVSQGIFAAFLALRIGAPAVVLSGISFSTTDHHYDKWQQRSHLDEDREALRAAVLCRLPIYAAAQHFAAESGLPLWTDEVSSPASAG